MKPTVAALLATTLIGVPALADDSAVLTEACEIALALSALPERLRDDASVVGLTRDGFRTLRERDGAFTCIVERNHPRALIPQCLDAAGKASILPALVFKSERVLSGDPPDTVDAAYRERLASGEFTAPARPGISYMASDYNYIYVASADQIRKVPPHVMFYAPGLDNDDVGGSFADGQANRGLPFVVDPGPHGYMVSFIERAASGDDVVAACADQVGDAPPALGDDA
ncbi:MAG: hypothetical protein R3288_11000 [Woeseiaceae bacterium]|nr:hypothetical protein [Woeseiaceae bacterium]